jgi:uncharacterized Zn-finger protein
MPEKTTPAVTNEEFKAKAQPITVKIGDTPLVCDAREFASGSVGWYAGGKVHVEVDGKLVKCQVGLNITVVGSKPEQPDTKAVAKRK